MRAPRPPLPWIATVLAVVYLVRPFTPPGPLRMLTGMWSPLLVAVAFTLLERRPWRESLNLGPGTPKTYGLAVAGAALVACLTAAMGLASGHLHATGGHPDPWQAVATFGMWVGGALGEELGWRGYLHVRLRGRRFAPLWVGLAWSAWHLRTVWEKGGSAWRGAIFVAGLFVGSWWLFWLTERSRSALPATLFHGTWNTLRNTIRLDDKAGVTDGWLWSDAPAFTDTEGAFGLVAFALIAALTFLAVRARPSPPVETARSGD